MNISIREIRKQAIQKLSNSPTPQLDVDCILAHITQENRSYLLAHDEEPLDDSEEMAQYMQNRIDEAIKKRQTGLPIAYITGHKEFYGLDFEVTPDVLIPKPDTELLVEKAIEITREQLSNRNSIFRTTFRIADICTGSGCVAISILNAIAETSSQNCTSDAIHITASDISEKAIEIAKNNAERLISNELSKSLDFSISDLLHNLAAFKFNLIVSNPPYVPAYITDEILKDGRNEPRLALDGDRDNSTDGLGLIKQLIPQSFKALVTGGTLLFEAGEYNIQECSNLMELQGFTNVEIFKDLSNKPRVVTGTKPEVRKNVFSDAY